MTATDFLYELGSGTVIPELDKQLQDTRAGDILKFNAPVPGRDEDVTFQVLVKDVKAKVLPDATDEWASEASEFDTVAELRGDLRRRMETVRRVEAQLRIRDQVVTALVDLVAEEVPDPLVNEEMQRRIHDLGHRLEARGTTLAQELDASGQTQEELVENLRTQSVQAVKADLALRAVADAESIEAEDTDIDVEVARLAERTGQKPAQVRRSLERAETLPAVRSDIRKGKALEWLVEHVDIVDEEGRPVDRADLEPPVIEPEPAAADGSTAEPEEHDK
jgi:trigger factor